MRLCLYYVKDQYGCTMIIKDKKQPYHRQLAVSGSLMSIFLPFSSGKPAFVKIGISWSDTSMFGSQKSKIFPRKFLPGFLWEIPCQQNSHIRLQPLRRHILLLLQWIALLSCKKIAFCLYKHQFQPSLEPDMRSYSIPLFMFLHKRQCFLILFLGSF